MKFKKRKNNEINTNIDTVQPEVDAKNIIMEKAVTVAKEYGNFSSELNGFGYFTEYEYETYGLNIKFFIDEYDNKQVEINFNKNLVFKYRWSQANAFIKPGVWEEMIDILYSDVQRLNETKEAQEEIHKNIEILKGKHDSGLININDLLNDIPLDILYDNPYVVYYQNNQVFLCRADGRCLKYIPGDWEQIISNLVLECDKKQEAEDLKSYNDFIRSRKK